MIKDKNKYMQFIDYSGLWARGSAISGDIDLCYIYKGCYVFVEFKTGNTKVSPGQETMYKTIVDALNATGTPACYCVARHNVRQSDVDGSMCIVTEWYMGQTMKSNTSVKEFIRYFMKINGHKIHFRSDCDAS